MHSTETAEDDTYIYEQTIKYDNSYRITEVLEVDKNTLNDITKYAMVQITPDNEGHRIKDIIKNISKDKEHSVTYNIIKKDSINNVLEQVVEYDGKPLFYETYTYEYY